MTDFVLVHGAFRGDWAWDRVRPLLEARGHRTFAPNLTNPDATLASYITTIGAVFEDHDLTDVVLVGHSQGGFITRAASEILADRIAHLIYIDAPVPTHGQTAFDFRPRGTDPPPVERGQVIPPRPIVEGPEIGSEDAIWINTRLVGQPVAPSMDPVSLQSPEALSLPETFVFFAHTPEGYPCALTRAELDAADRPYVVLEAGHDGIVTHPEPVAAKLLEIVAGASQV